MRSKFHKPLSKSYYGTLPTVLEVGSDPLSLKEKVARKSKVWISSSDNLFVKNIIRLNIHERGNRMLPVVGDALWLRIEYKHLYYIFYISKTIPENYNGSRGKLNLCNKEYTKLCTLKTKIASASCKFL